MKDKNFEKDIALIAKEVGLEENLFTPTGEGLKAKVKHLETDINGVGKKVNGIEERVKKLETNYSLPPPTHHEKKETKDPNEHAYKALLGYGRKAWRIFKPILYALGLLMLYAISKMLDIDIPLIPFIH